MPPEFCHRVLENFAIQPHLISPFCNQTLVKGEGAIIGYEGRSHINEVAPKLRFTFSVRDGTFRGSWYLAEEMVQLVLRIDREASVLPPGQTSENDGYPVACRVSSGVVLHEGLGIVRLVVDDTEIEFVQPLFSTENGYTLFGDHNDWRILWKGVWRWKGAFTID